MSNYFNPDDWGGMLPEGVSPMPNIGANCVECGEPVHIYESDLSEDERGLVCGACNRRKAKRQRSADGRREITKQHKWKHGHDPADDEDSRHPDIVYINLKQEQAPAIVRPAFGGGPETPFPCETCGTKLRAVGERTVEQVLEPLGYRPPPGTKAPTETIVALVCPNDKPGQRHKYMQIRSGFLEYANRTQNHV